MNKLWQIEAVMNLLKYIINKLKVSGINNPMVFYKNIYKF